ncbi:hypothetical protein [Streptomyces longispororuber]|nr:hypothetical protein [Streptomyces longispororuber]
MSGAVAMSISPRRTMTTSLPWACAEATQDAAVGGWKSMTLIWLG